MVNEGWYKKYKYQGPYFHGLSASIDAVKQKGIMFATFDFTSEGMTASSDPGLSTNISTASTQSVTSTGECSLFAYYLREQRIKAFLASNLTEVKYDIANGGGEYTKAIAELSLCRVGKEASVNSILTENYSEIFKDTDSAAKVMSSTIYAELVNDSRCLFDLKA